MLHLTPLSFLYCILLCYPLAFIFISTTPPTTTTTPPTTKRTDQINPQLILLPSRKSVKNTQKTKPLENNSTNTKPPTESADDSDEMLLQLASRVNPYPQPVNKLAFMFLTTSPLPLAPLWESFFSRAATSLYNIYIHADPRLNYTASFTGIFANRVIPSKPTRRHSPTLISSVRRLLSHALLHDKSNSMFALLSPSCIPIHSFNYTYRTLTKSRKSFIEILDNEPGAYDRWAARGETTMLPELKYEDFRIGSQFWVLTRHHARTVVSDTRLWSKFKLPCLINATCYPDEHYFPTLMNMVDPSGCVPCTLTHVDWNGSRGGHPRMYKGGDVGPELIGALRKRRPRYGDEKKINGSDLSVKKRKGDPFLFARKFSSGSLHQLMGLADDVIFKD